MTIRKLKRGCLHGVLVTVMAIGILPLFPQPALSHGSVCRLAIERMIEAVVHEADDEKRIDLSIELTNYARQHLPCGLAPRTIDRLAGLLGDRAEGVRISAAMALGDLGPAARRAVPALRRAIEESDQRLDADATVTADHQVIPNTVLPVNTSGNEARAAIRMITGENVPEYVGGWKKKKLPAH
jgi:HEAT repeat protein